MDEGYFIGAALRFLNGSFFLEGSSFDYPLILVVVHSLGVVLGGKTHLGFRLINGLLFLGCYIQFVRILRNIPRRPQGLWFELLVQSFALGLFSQQMMTFLGFSAFSESIVLFFSLTLYLEWQRGREQELRLPVVAYLLPLSVFSKYSAVFWWLGGLGVWRGSLRQSFEVLFRKTWWLWGLCILFALKTGGFKSFQTAFSPFQQSASPNDGKMSLLLKYWLDGFGKSSVLAASMGLAVFLSVVLFSVRTRWWRGLRQISKPHLEDLSLIFLPMLLQTTVFATIQASRFHERYLFIYWPQVILVITFLFLQLQESKALIRLFAKIVGLGLALGYLLVGLVSNPLNEQTSIYLSSEWGRIFYRLAFATPEGATIFVPPQYNWEMRPWMLMSPKTYVGCDDPECILQNRVGQPVRGDQFVLKKGPEGQPFLTSAPLVAFSSDLPKGYYSCVTRKELRWAPRSKGINMADLLLERFRQRGAFDVTEVSAERLRLRSRKPVLGVHPEIMIRGQFFASVSAAENSPQKQWYSFFEFKAFEILPWAINALDLMPMFFKGYTVRLEPIEWPYHDNEIVQMTGLSDTLDSYRLEIETAQCR